MTTQQKIEAIKEAINKAEQRQSKLKPENFDVPGFVSLQGRHLYNNIGALATRVCEVGSHLGCSLTSAITENNQILSVTAIDSFESDLVEERQCMPIFLSNIEKFLPKETKFKFIHSDAFEVNIADILSPIDFYIYDGDHKTISQEKAFTYYKDCFADEFIAIIDDADWVEVQEGTASGIKKCGFEILFEKHLPSAKSKEDGGHDNESWFNGYYVVLLRKK